MTNLWRIAMTLGMWAAATGADETETLLGEDLSAWREPRGEWRMAGAVSLDPKDEARLSVEPGAAVAVNGDTGKTVDLVSKPEHGDIEAHMEFLVP